MITKFDIGEVVCCVSKDGNKLIVSSFKIEKIFIDSEGISYFGYDRDSRYKEEYLARTPEELERKYFKMLSEEIRERKLEFQQLFKEYKIIARFFPGKTTIDEQIGLQREKAALYVYLI